MTRQEAYQKMLSGNKVTHISFSKYEYLHIKDGVVKDENDYNFQEGWKIRTGEVWQSGWSLYE